MAEDPNRPVPNRAQRGVQKIVDTNNRVSELKERARAATLDRIAGKSNKSLETLEKNIKNITRLGIDQTTVNSINNLSMLSKSINSLSPIKILKAKMSLKMLGTSLDAFHGRNFDNAAQIGSILDSLKPMNVLKARAGMILLGKSLERLGVLSANVQQQTEKIQELNPPNIIKKGLTPAQIQAKMQREWEEHQDRGGNNFAIKKMSVAEKNQRKIESEWAKTQWEEGQHEYVPGKNKKPKGPIEKIRKRSVRGSDGVECERTYRNKRRKPKPFEIKFAGGGFLGKLAGGAKALGRSVFGAKEETPIRTPGGRPAVVGERGPEAIVPLKKLPEVAEGMAEKGIGEGAEAMSANQRIMMQNQAELESGQDMINAKSTETLREISDVKNKLSLGGAGAMTGGAAGVAAMAGGGSPLMGLLMDLMPKLTEWKTNIKDFFEKTKESFKNVWSDVKSGFVKIKDTIFEKAASIKKTLSNLGKKIWDSVGPRLSGMMTKAQEVFAGLKGKIGDFAGSAKDKIGNVASAAKDKAGMALDWMKGKLGQAKDMGSNVMSKGKDALDKLNPLQFIKSQKGKIFPKLAEGLKKFGKKMPGIGPLLLMYEGVTTASEAYDLIKAGMSPRDVAIQMMPKAGEALGSLIGAGAGSAIPIPILGTLGGALAGGAGGRFLTEYFAEDIVDALGIGKDMKFPKAIQEKLAMAEGGIVTKPVDALVGESGPEAVIPLKDGFKEFGDNLFDHFIKRAEESGSVDGLKMASKQLSIGSLSEQSSEMRSQERVSLAMDIASMISIPEQSVIIPKPSAPPMPAAILTSADGGHMHNIYKIKFNI